VHDRRAAAAFAWQEQPASARPPLFLSMVARLFGSWEAAQHAAGFTPRRRRWTKAAVIDALTS
jgi:hypothetical protein